MIFFTTLRLRNNNKYKVGNRHKIILNEKGVLRDHGIGEIIAIRVLRLHQLNEFICGLDTGYTIDETKQILYKMYTDRVSDVNQAEFNLVLYKKEKAQNAQNKLFQW